MVYPRAQVAQPHCSVGEKTVQACLRIGMTGMRDGTIIIVS